MRLFCSFNLSEVLFLFLLRSLPYFLVCKCFLLGETRPFLRGIDVNRAPSTVDVEEEAGVSSPNSTLSSISGKRSERDPTGEENEVERACSRGLSDEEDGDGSRKKLRLSKDQSAVLEESFKEHNTLNPVSKMRPFFLWSFYFLVQKNPKK